MPTSSNSSKNQFRRLAKHWYLTEIMSCPMVTPDEIQEFEELMAIAEAARDFKAAIDREEAEYGFPFSFDLRAAHRAFVKALEP